MIMNKTIFYFFYNLAHQSIFFDNLIVFFAVYFPYLVILLAALFLIFPRRFSRGPDPILRASGYRSNWKEFFLVFFSSGLAVFFDLILKYLIHAPRPFVVFTNISALFPESGYAFPSGHATFFMALAISLFFLNKKAGRVFMFFALLIGLARIIAGVHFPIDILGGFVLGALVALLFKRFILR